MDGLLGLTVAFTPKLSAIGRVGYEDVRDESISDITDVIWSGGLQFRPGEHSTISVERRHRFGQDAWYGDANIALSSMFAMTAGYEEHFEDQQLRLARALGDVFNQSGDLPVVPSPVNLNEDLVNLA